MLSPALLWPFAIGGVGGGLNALLTDDRRLLPEVIRTRPGRRRPARAGLLANLALGGCTHAACVWALGAPDVTSAVLAGGLRLLLFVAAGLVIGFIAARCVTAEIDARLLREAACHAAAAPAAHPDVVHRLETTSAYAMYRIAEGLMPPRASHDTS